MAWNCELRVYGVRGLPGFFAKVSEAPCTAACGPQRSGPKQPCSLKVKQIICWKKRSSHRNCWKHSICQFPKNTPSVPARFPESFKAKNHLASLKLIFLLAHRTAGSTKPARFPSPSKPAHRNWWKLLEAQYLPDSQVLQSQHTETGGNCWKHNTCQVPQVQQSQKNHLAILKLIFSASTQKLLEAQYLPARFPSPSEQKIT